MGWSCAGGIVGGIEDETRFGTKFRANNPLLSSWIILESLGCFLRILVCLEGRCGVANAALAQC